jgi:tetratricopeptide (TPR) repeat protein
MNLLVLLNTGQASSLNEFVQRFINVAESMAGLLGLFYLMVIAVILLAGLSLIGETRARLPLFAGEWSAMTAAPIFGVALWLLFATNFSAIRADIVFKQGQPYIANNACNGAGNPLSQCDIAIAHLKQALAHAPDEDFYMLALGASYLNKSAAAADGPPQFVASQSYDSILRQSAESTAALNRRDALTAAQVTLEHARQINPLNTDHSANLARLHRRWADLAADDAERQQRLDEAGAYYAEATMLSPRNAQLWNEWAIVYFGVHELATRLGDATLAATALDQAEAKLDESLRLDQLFADTYLYLHSLYTARGQSDKAQEALTEAQRLSPDNPDVWGRLTEQLLASGNVTEAERISLHFVTRNPGFLPAWRMLSQRIFFPQGRVAEAIDAARRSVELSASDPEHWTDLLWLAQTLGPAGNLPEALTYAQAALDAAPVDRQAEVQQVLDSIQAALSGTPPPSSP